MARRRDKSKEAAGKQIERDFPESKGFRITRTWVREALLAGQTLTDPGLWIAGVDDPAAMMRSLRKEGMLIKTSRKTVTDAAGEKHRVPAWHLEGDTTCSG